MILPDQLIPRIEKDCTRLTQREEHTSKFNRLDPNSYYLGVNVNMMLKSHNIPTYDVKHVKELLRKEIFDNTGLEPKIQFKLGMHHMIQEVEPDERHWFMPRVANYMVFKVDVDKDGWLLIMLGV